MRRHIERSRNKGYRCYAGSGLPAGWLSRPSAPLFGRFIVEFNHHAVGIGDENLPNIDTGHLPDVERQTFGLKSLLHAGETTARKGDMVDHPGIRLLLLIRLRNIDEMNHRLALAVHPGPGKREVRPVALLEVKNLLVEPNRIPEFPGPDIEMIEHAYAHAMSLPLC